MASARRHRLETASDGFDNPKTTKSNPKSCWLAAQSNLLESDVEIQDFLRHIVIPLWPIAKVSLSFFLRFSIFQSQNCFGRSTIIPISGCVLRACMGQLAFLRYALETTTKANTGSQNSALTRMPYLRDGRVSRRVELLDIADKKGQECSAMQCLASRSRDIYQTHQFQTISVAAITCFPSESYRTNTEQLNDRGLVWKNV